MMDPKNILLIGRTSVDEDRLADLLRGSEGLNIIDSTEFTNEVLESEEDIAKQIKEACCAVKKEITQVLFIFGGRLNKQEEKVYDIIKERIFFDKKIAEFTTIVRTNFPNFSEPQECRKDIGELEKKFALRYKEEEIKKLEGEIKKLKEKKDKSEELVNKKNQLKVYKKNKDMSELISKKIIYIWVPKLKEDNKNIKEMREKSRNILLDHLKTCKNDYGPNYCLELISEIIENYSKKDELEGVLIKKREEIKKKGMGARIIRSFKNKEVKEVGNEKEVREKKKEIENSSLKAAIEINDSYK